MKLTRTRQALLSTLAIASLTLAACSSGDSAEEGTATSGTSGTAAAGEAAADAVHLYLFNDFHGALEPPEGSSGKINDVEAGGAAYLSTHFKQLQEKTPNSAIVAVGDNIGASPLVSQLFHGEPTIEFFNDLGVQASSVGNHEFDQGTNELRRIQEGGCALDGCVGEGEYAGAKFPYLAANVTNEAGELPPGTKPFTTIKVGDKTIGLVGTVTAETATLVSPDGIRGFTFGDQAEAINKYVPELKAAGADAIVALVHDGGKQNGEGADINTCDEISSNVTELAEAVDDAVSSIAMAHSHQFYSCEIDGKTVTQAGSNGRLITDLALSFNGADVSATAENLVVTRDVEPDAQVEEKIKFYSDKAAPLVDRPVGELAEDLSRDPYAGGDSPLGNFIAEGMLQSTRSPNAAEAVIAMTNPGGVRADLAGGAVSYGDAYNVLPFGNQVVTVTLTGSQLLRVLEQQWADLERVNILPLAGMTYSVSKAPEGEAPKIDEASIRIGDQPFNRVGTYRVATNNFLLGGGDGFSAFTEGTDVTVGGIDLDVFEAFLNSPEGKIMPQTRITVAG